VGDCIAVFTLERKLIPCIQALATGKKLAPEQAGKHPYRKEEPASCGLPPAVGCNAPCCDDHVDVGVKAHVAAPGVEDGHVAHRRPQVLGVGGELPYRLAGSPEEQLVELARVLQHQRIELCGDGEHGMEVFHIQHILLPLSYPLLLSHRLALGAVAVPAGVVGLAGVPAIRTDVGMPSQGLGAAFHDRLCRLLGLQGNEMASPVLVKRGKEHILHLSHG